jgi:hypothetical protein
VGRRRFDIVPLLYDSKPNGTLRALAAYDHAITAWLNIIPKLQAGTKEKIIAHIDVSDIYFMRAKLCKDIFGVLNSEKKSAGTWPKQAADAWTGAIYHLRMAENTATLVVLGEKEASSLGLAKDQLLLKKRTIYDELVFSYSFLAAFASTGKYFPIPGFKGLSKLAKMPEDVGELARTAMAHTIRRKEADSALQALSGSPKR